MFNLSDRYAARGRHHGIEVARGLAIDEIAPLIALPRLDEREVGAQRAFHDVLAPVEDALFFVLRDYRAHAGGREEGRNAGATCADALGKRPLRIQLQLQLAREHHLLEQLVLADVRPYVLANLPRAQQQAETKIVDAGVVAHRGEVLHTLADDGGDQVFRNPAEPEAAHKNRGAIV